MMIERYIAEKYIDNSSTNHMSADVTDDFMHNARACDMQMQRNCDGNHSQAGCPAYRIKLHPLPQVLLSSTQVDRAAGSHLKQPCCKHLQVK